MTLESQFVAASAQNREGSGSWTAPTLDLDGARVAAMLAEGEPLVWDTYPQAEGSSPLAGKDQKLSGGFGGAAPEYSARCAAGIVAAGGAGAQSAGLSSLDLLKNNRHTPANLDRPQGRGKYCGRMAVTSVDPKTGRKVFRRVNCNSWTCSYCGPRKARTARAAIRRVAEGLGLRYFLTLTLDPSKLTDLGGKQFYVPYLRTVFNKFREYLRRLYGRAPAYICVLEFTEKGIPHLHILFDRYLAQKWISNVWGSLGGGRICFIKQVTVANVSRYLSKYLTKDLLLSAPKGSRRITTARSIKLFPKFDSGMVWELLKQSIWQCLEQVRGEQFFCREQDFFKFISVEVDEEKFLKKFEIVDLC